MSSGEQKQYHLMGMELGLVQVSMNIGSQYGVIAQLGYHSALMVEKNHPHLTNRTMVLRSPQHNIMQGMAG